MKAASAGEDTPKAVFPTPVGWISKDKLGGDAEMKEAKSDKRSKSRGKKAAKENEEEEEDAEEKKKGEKSTKTLGINDDPTKTRRYYVDDASFRRDHLDLTCPLDEDGDVRDWDAVEAIWEHTLRKRLVVQSDEHPILLSEPVHVSARERAKKRWRFSLRNTTRRRCFWPRPRC